MQADAKIELANLLMFNANELGEIQKESPNIHTALVQVIAAIAKKYGITPQQQPVSRSGSNLPSTWEMIISFFIKAETEVFETYKIISSTELYFSKEKQSLYERGMKIEIFKSAQSQKWNTLLFELPEEAYSYLANNNYHLLNNYLSITGFFGPVKNDIYIKLFDNKNLDYFDYRLFRDYRGDYIPQTTTPQIAIDEKLEGYTMKYPNGSVGEIKKIVRKNPKTDSYEIDFIEGTKKGSKGKLNIDRRLKQRLLAGEKVSGYYLIEKQKGFTKTPDPVTQIALPQKGTSDNKAYRDGKVFSIDANTGNRPSPTQSASTVKPGTKAIGNNSEWYEVKQTKRGVNMWVKSTPPEKIVPDENDYSQTPQDILEMKRDEIKQAMKEFEEGEPEYEELKTELQIIELYINE